MLTSPLNECVWMRPHPVPLLKGEGTKPLPPLGEGEDGVCFGDAKPRRKKPAVLRVVFAIMLLCVNAEVFAQDTLLLPVNVPLIRSLPNSAFAVGEKLVFDVGFSFITAGEAVFEIPQIDTVSDRPCYRVVFTVNSTPSFSWIYRVEDRYETSVDVQGLFPWRFSTR